MSRRRLVLVGALVMVGGLVAGLVLPAQGAGKSGSRKVFMSAVEYKGGANVAEEAYPPVAEPGTLELAPLGGSYRLKAPDASGRWEVSSYRFEPGLLVVKEGQRVTLEIAGINGARHDAALVSPSGKTQPFVVTRGRLTLVKFKASEKGLWKLVCGTHAPGMTAQILVV